MAVAGMAAYSEITRAHEVANEMRRINKQLKDAQQMAITYNNRERLFGMPVTNVSVHITLTRCGFCCMGLSLLRGRLQCGGFDLHIQESWNMDGSYQSPDFTGLHSAVV